MSLSPADQGGAEGYEGSGTADRRWLHADERGSVIGVSNGSGASLAINAYDEYGVPASGNLGRFQYTGQTRLPELGLYHYKARIYSPELGRFLQPDPIGYGGGMNLYAYARNDPVNLVDPLGLQDAGIIVTGTPYTTICTRTGCEWISFLNSQTNDTSGWPQPQQFEPQLAAAGMPQRACRDADPSPTFMNNTTNVALASVPGGGRTTALSSEFSQLAKQPDFRSPGWRSVGSSHAYMAFEHSLPGSDRVVKVYLGDDNFSGSNTVTITSPTNSIEHYAEFPSYLAGRSINTANANDYWKGRLGCE